ncbi:MAG: hypothetical protein FGM23_04970 [Alphaproteobacteria bacterium]|nr:hypothetical protein [Alphaproteobacteria bacterium]
MSNFNDDDRFYVSERIIILPELALVYPTPEPLAGYAAPDAVLYNFYEDRAGAYGCSPDKSVSYEWCVGVQPDGTYWARLSTGKFYEEVEQSSLITTTHIKIQSLVLAYQAAILNCQIVEGTAVYDPKTKTGRVEILTWERKVNPDYNGEGTGDPYISSGYTVSGKLTAFYDIPCDDDHPLRQKWPDQVPYASYTNQAYPTLNTDIMGGPNATKVHELIADAAKVQNQL